MAQVTGHSADGEDHEAAARVVKLRGYGNAINAEVATAFIKAYLEIEKGRT